MNYKKFFGLLPVLVVISFYLPVPVMAHQCNDGIDNDGDGVIDLLDSDCQSEWETLAPMPTARSSAAAAVLDGEIYVAGGSNTNTIFNSGLTTVEIYSIEENLWKTGVPLQQKRYASHVMETVGDKLYVIGGLARTNGSVAALSSTEVFDKSTMLWSYANSMPTARYGLASAVIQDEIYVIGGVALNNLNRPTPALDLMEVYNAITDTWQAKSAPPVPVHSAGAEVVGGKIYLIGGQNTNELSISDVQIYDPQTDTWSLGKNMPSTRTSPGTAVFGDSIIVFGGNERDAFGASFPNEVYLYDTVLNEWFELEDLPNSRTQLGSVEYAGFAYAIGGSSDGPVAFLGINEAIKIPNFEGVPIVKSIEDLIAELEEKVETGVSAGAVKNSYEAQCKKLQEFYKGAQYNAFENQLSALKQKIEQDTDRGEIEAVLADALLSLIEQIHGQLDEEMTDVSVPLITQVASPYPPESAEWEDNMYASGGSYWCGDNIGECGCALASMSMLAQSYGETQDIAGGMIQPGNMNAWLQDNNGYTPGGNVIWGKILEYFGTLQGNKIVTNFSFDTHNETDIGAIDAFLGLAQPVVAFNNRLGHYFVLTEKNDDASYAVRDPFWFNTSATNESKDAANQVQAYNNEISKANLFSHNETKRPLSGLIEVHLGSPAELLISDASGNRSGFANGTIVTEIVGSSYDQSEIILSGKDDSNTHPEKVLLVKEPTEEIYQLDVVGTGNGDYDLTIYLANDEGQSSVLFVSGSTSSGGTDSYQLNLDFDTDSGHGNEIDGCDEDNPGKRPVCQL